MDFKDIEKLNLTWYLEDGHYFGKGVNKSITLKLNIPEYINYSKAPNTLWISEEDNGIFQVDVSSKDIAKLFTYIEAKILQESIDEIEKQKAIVNKLFSKINEKEECI